MLRPLQGFFAAIEEHWLHSFSAREVQRLISGDDTDLDMADLKRHVVYAGGYYASHRVVQWLWQVGADVGHRRRLEALRSRA